MDTGSSLGGRQGHHRMLGAQKGLPGLV